MASHYPLEIIKLTKHCAILLNLFCSNGGLPNCVFHFQDVIFSWSSKRSFPPFLCKMKCLVRSLSFYVPSLC